MDKTNRNREKIQNEYGHILSEKFAKTQALRKEFQALSKENRTLIIKLQKSVEQIYSKED